MRRWIADAIGIGSASNLRVEGSGSQGCFRGRVECKESAVGRRFSLLVMVRCH